jgi:hypothetical protein
MPLQGILIDRHTRDGTRRNKTEPDWCNELTGLMEKVIHRDSVYNNGRFEQSNSFNYSYRVWALRNKVENNLMAVSVDCRLAAMAI